MMCFCRNHAIVKFVLQLDMDNVPYVPLALQTPCFIMIDNFVCVRDSRLFIICSLNISGFGASISHIAQSVFQPKKKLKKILMVYIS